MSDPTHDTEERDPAAGQVFRVVESSDEQPDATAESKSEQPARRSRRPLAVLAPLGLTAVLGVVGLVQGGLGWWAAAAGAGVVGTPVAVAVARRAAKRRSQRERFSIAPKQRSRSRLGSGRSGGAGLFGRLRAGRGGVGRVGAVRGGSRRGSRFGAGAGSRGSRSGRSAGSRSGSPAAGRGSRGRGVLGRLFGRGRSGPAARGGGAGGASRRGALGRRGAFGRGGGRTGRATGLGGLFGRHRGKRDVHRGRGRGGAGGGKAGAGSPQSRREQRRQARHGRQAMRLLKRFVRRQDGRAADAGSRGESSRPRRGRWAGRVLRRLFGRRKRAGSESAGPVVDASVTNRKAANARTTKTRRQRFADRCRSVAGALGFGIGTTGRFGYLGLAATRRGLAGAGRWTAGRVHEWATTGPASWFRLAIGWATRRWAGAHRTSATTAAGPRFGEPPQAGGPVAAPRPGPTPTPAGPGSAPVAPAAPLAKVVSISSGGSTMSHPINDAAAEAGSAVGSYEPRNLVDIRNFTQSTPEQLGKWADGYTAVSERLSETPAGGAAAEPYAQIAAHLRALASNSGEIAGQLAAYNATDFERIDNPRPNEHMADYGQNEAG